MVALERTAGGWRIDGVEFVEGFARSSAVDRFWLQKPPALVERYIGLAERFDRPLTVEVGLAGGGGSALLALLLEPSLLIGIEYEERRIAALDELAAARGLPVRAHFGVDQADRGRVADVVDREREGRPLDLVIDDASHFYDETLATFEVLFPRIRPGGLFVIEDWSWLEQLADRIERDAAEDPEFAARVAEAEADGRVPSFTPLSRLAVELLLVQTTSTDVIGDVTVNEHWTVVERGPAPLDGSFRLGDHYRDRHHYLGVG